MQGETTMFECSICQTHFHKSRTHCPVCGAVPAVYSMLGVPAVFKDYTEIGELPRLVPIGAAFGSHSLTMTRTREAVLKTVALDYYADREA